MKIEEGAAPVAARWMRLENSVRPRATHNFRLFLFCAILALHCQVIFTCLVIIWA